MVATIGERIKKIGCFHFNKESGFSINCFQKQQLSRIVLLFSARSNVLKLRFDHRSCNRNLSNCEFSDNVCKSGPMHFRSEKNFPSNFAQLIIIGCL